jgi:hypothetical protein
MAKKKPAKKSAQRPDRRRGDRSGGPAQPNRKSKIINQKSKILPAQQGQGPESALAGPKRTDVGPGRPPVEHQFQPGQSGNPAGAPRARTNLWPRFCEFEGLTEAEVKRIQNDKNEPLVRRTAAKQALQLYKKGIGGTGIIATKEIWNRDEGKPTEHVRYEREEAMTPQECEELRRLLQGKEPQ